MEHAATRRFVDYLSALAARGGPSEHDEVSLNNQVNSIYQEILAGRVSRESVFAELAAANLLVDGDSIQGHCLSKPYGYAGDFEIIDRLYTQWVSPNDQLAPWDRFLHRQPATKAVRNRKEYFKGLLDALHARGGGRVLKVALGPGRSMHEWLDANPDANIHFDCVDIDDKAIAYTQALNARHADKITYHHRNVLHFKPLGTYDLVWSAGLFDYFSDRAFKTICRRLWPAVAENGQLVIGNFDVGNPTRAYMEVLCDWNLHHRSPAELRRLIVDSGIGASRIHIGVEPEGVNLFIHAMKDDAFATGLAPMQFRYAA
jgi:extracellular factor (EF) 3-hydroxypalmitic acid methyl ester biosynthesis protein